MLIGISGMIGSGKSVLSQRLANYYAKHALLLQEFVGEDEVFTTMLKWLYERKPNFDVTFQAYVIEYHLGLVEQIRKEFQAKNMDPNNDLIFLDRFIAEHYVFASVNLANSQPKIKKAYEVFFEQMVTPEDLPDFAIYLDVSYETFKQRLFARGRKVEIDGWEQNKAYFKKLLAIYKDTFTQVAKRFKIPFAVIDTNNLTEEQVFKQAITLIENYKKEKHELTPQS